MSRFCDAIITINHEDYNNAKKMHCPKTYIIPSVGLDNHRFANLRINRDEYRASFGVNSKDHMILAVSELSSRKNQKIIIEALGTLDRKEQYIFVICGTAVVNSTIEEELKETASKLGVRIFLAGHRLDIPEINACADVAVIPSVREGFGMTGVEALASGVPVVGSDVQGIREYVIPGKTGYLCDPYDAHQFADAIEKIVNLPSEERAKMVIACKEKAKEFEKSLQEIDITYATEKQRVISIDENIEQIQKRIEKLKQEKNRTAESQKETVASKEANEKQIENMNKQNEEDQKIIDEFSNANKDSQKYIDDLNFDITNLKISVSSFNESEVSIQEITEMIQKEIETHSKNKENKKLQIENADKENEILKTEIEDTKQAIEKIKSKVSNSGDAIGKLKKERIEKNEKLTKKEDEQTEQFKTIQN